MRALEITIDGIMGSINAINTRAVTATARCAADYDLLLTALAHAHARVLRVHCATAHANDKLLYDKAEEADTASKQLAAVATLCTAPSHRVRASALLETVGRLSMLEQSVDGDGARLCEPVSAFLSSALASMSTVWRELPDGAVSTVSGPGMQSFVKGAAGATRNVMLAYPRVSSAALAEYVKPDDVCLMFKDDAGSLIGARVTVERVDDGGFQVAYVVAAGCENKLSASVTVCGVAIGPVVTVRSGYDVINGTKHVASYDVGEGPKFGMAVNAKGNMMAVSHDGPLNQVHVFQLTPSFARVCVIRQDGTNTPAFSSCYRLCFADDDSLLLCDRYNNRVQQVTLSGENLRAFPVQSPFSIAAHVEIFAVGTYGSFIEMHSFATGECIRRFGSRGEGPGQIASWATGIRFSLDATCVLVAECGSRMSLFTVDGVFVKSVRGGSGVLDDGFNDVSFGAGCEIIVADWANSRICVLSPDGDTLIKTWGSRGTSAGQFSYPSAVAVAGSYLYVMDATQARVQVFE